MSAATTTATAGTERQSTYSWFVLFVLCSVYILNFLDRQLLAILTEPIKNDLGLSDTQMGLLGGIYFAAFYTIIGVPVGWLADRTNRVRILAAGCFLWSLGTFACGRANSFATLAAGRMLVGFGEAGGAPPSYSIISDYFAKEKRGTALALFSLGVPFGQALGAGFGAKTAELYGWRTAFIALGVIGIVMSILVVILVREPKRGAKDVKLDTHMQEAPTTALDDERPQFFRTMKEFFGNPTLTWLAFAAGMCSFVGYAVLNWTVPFLIREKGINMGEVALYYALMLAVAMGLGNWLSGVLVDWLGKRSRRAYALVPAAAMTLAIPFYILFLMAPTWQWSMVFLAVPTCLNIVYLAPALAVVQNTVRPSQRTMSGALLLMVINLIGLGGGPTLIGWLSDQFAPAYGVHSLYMALFALVPVYVIAVVLLLMEARALSKDVRDGVKL